MTIRSSAHALQRQKFRRAQTLCTVFEVTRRDGFVLRWTDHDRPLTIDGDTFSPLGLGSVSAERREAGLRPGNQEARGPIDGTTITIPDMLGRLYVGAIVEQRTVDWRQPWIWHRVQRKRIRQVAQDGSSWVATLEGFGAELQRNVGSRFGGTHSRECGYTWGDPSTCRADRTTGLQYGPSLGFTVTSSTISAVADSSASWTTNQWIGWKVVITSGALKGEERNIIGNDTTTLFVDVDYASVPLVGVTFVVGQGVAVDSVSDARMVFVLKAADYTSGAFDDDYFRDGEVEWMTGDNLGHISPIIGYTKTARTVTLLLPTPFDIAVGDRGIVRTGCNGLKQTCIDKFSNVDNFGGTDVYAKRPGDALEQV